MSEVKLENLGIYVDEVIDDNGSIAERYLSPAASLDEHIRQGFIMATSKHKRSDDEEEYFEGYLKVIAHNVKKNLAHVLLSEVYGPNPEDHEPLGCRVMHELEKLVGSPEYEQVSKIFHYDHDYQLRRAKYFEKLLFDYE